MDVTFKTTCVNAPRCLAGNISVKMVVVPPCAVKLAMSQEVGHFERLQGAGYFDYSPKFASTRELSGVLGGTPDFAMGTVNTDLLLQTRILGQKNMGNPFLAATNANEAPLHLGQITWDRWKEGLWNREQYGEPLDQKTRVYHCVAQALGSDVVEFEKVVFTTPTENPFIDDTRPENRFSVAASGKPIIWDGTEVSFAHTLRPMLSDLRPLIQLPLLEVPLGRRRIIDLVLADKADEVEAMVRGKQRLVLSIEQERLELNQVGIEASGSDIEKALLESGLRYEKTGDRVSLQPEYGYYRHSFWAKHGNGSLMMGFVSNDSGDLNQWVGMTIPDMQQLFLGLGATEVLLFGAGKDNRLYWRTQDRAYHKEVDSDARAATPSGLLMLFGRK